MWEYKVITERNVEDLEQKLGEYGSSGWKVIYFLQGKSEDFFDRYTDYVSLLEREKPESTYFQKISE